MAKDVVTNLGAALTQLGIEDKFLANGELTSFPLAERGRIANGIIEEKLKSGKWATVVQLLFGSKTNAHALYEGDYEQLKKDILQSAISSQREYYKLDDIVRNLLDSKEFDLLFGIACSLQIKYDKFNRIVMELPKEYYDDHNGQNLHTFHQIAGKKALEEDKLDSAALHFIKTGDKENLEVVFESMLADSAYSHIDRLEKIALDSATKQEDMLKRIILACSSEKGGALSSLKLYWKYMGSHLSLPEKDVSKLYANAASEVRGFEMTRLPCSADNRLRLLWAKKHAESEPQLSYRIFKVLGYKGKEVRAAVLSGLQIRRYQHEEQVLTPQDILGEHLESAYKFAPFNVKAEIAKHLNNNKRLQKLSKQAEQKGDLKEAYWLWISGSGDLKGEYVTDIRKRLIRAEIKEGYCFMSFLRENDRPGKLQACDALMVESLIPGSKTQQYKCVEAAYKLARSLSDEERAQRAREHLVSLSPELALEAFAKDKKNRDKTGIEYLVSVMAQRLNVEAPTLTRIIEKYATG